MHISLYDDVCDMKDCPNPATKRIIIGGLGVLGRLSSDTFELCPKHYIEEYERLQEMGKKTHQEAVRDYNEDKKLDLNQ